MINKKITINKNIILILTLIVVLVSCSSKNKITDTVNNSQAVVSEVNYISDKNTDIIFLETIYFDFDSYMLTIESNQNLNLLVKYLRDTNNKHKNVILSGYCDDLGSSQYNYELGLKRAEETKKYLLNAGMNKNRIITKSYGKGEQTTKENLEITRSANRKVIIEIK